MSRVAVIAVVVLLLAGLLRGCGGESTESTADLTTYRHSFDQVPRTLDPLQATSLYINFIVINTYDTLFSYKYLKRPYELKPNLAAAMPEVSEDGLTYTIRLKQGVRFMDDEAFEGGVGREVCASDFVYMLKRHFDPKARSQGSWLYDNRIVGVEEWVEAGADYDSEIAGLKSPDCYTVSIELLRPYPQLVHTLAQGFSAIVPREAVEKYGRDLATRPVGSGPFIVREFDSTRVVMERNPNYRREPVDIYFEGFDETIHGPTGVEAIHGRSPPFVDRIQIDFIADATARVNSLLKGDEINFGRLEGSSFDTFLTGDETPTLKTQYADQLNILAGIEPGFVFHTFNMQDPDFGYSEDPEQNERNRALRCAVIKGFNWKERDARFYGGIAAIFPGIIPPVVPEYDPAAPRDSVIHDPEGARALLAEYDWTADNLPEFTYGVPSSVRQTQMFEQFRGFMQDIGYPGDKLILKQYAAFGDISRDWKNAKLPLVNKAWGLDFPDAENTLQLYYGPNGSPGSNDANYANPEYDRLYEQAAVMQPGPDRTTLYRQMNQMIIDDCLAMTGLSRNIILLWHKDVIAYPDRNIVGGFWAKYVDLKTTSP